MLTFEQYNEKDCYKRQTVNSAGPSVLKSLIRHRYIIFSLHKKDIKKKKIKIGKSQIQWTCKDNFTSVSELGTQPGLCSGVTGWEKQTKNSLPFSEGGSGR